MTCVAFATIGFFSSLTGEGAYATLAILVILADALLGTAIFVSLNKKEIMQQFAFVEKIPSPIKASQIEQSITIAFKMGGNIIELGRRDHKGQKVGSNGYFEKV